MSILKPEPGSAIRYGGGAVRSERKPRYRDIPFEFIERVAAAFTRGVHYEEAAGLPPWDKNWEHGDTEFALDAIDHAIEHLFKYKEGVRSRLVAGVKAFDDEDHLGHCGANLAMLAFYEERGFFDAGAAPQPQPEPQITPEESPLDLLPSAQQELQDTQWFRGLLDKMNSLRGSLRDPEEKGRA